MPNAAEGLTVGESLTEGKGYASAGEMPGERAEGTGGAKSPKVSYERPSGYRKGVCDKAWESAKNKSGEVIDPTTKKVIRPDEPWDMGHKPGYEFRKHQQSAQERGISRKEFLNEHNIYKHYRPELPSSNRSHVGEDVTDNYFGS